MSKEFEVILRAYNDKNQKFDLNIIDNISLKLDISAIESQEIGKIFGISSQTFSLPGTDENNQYFNNVFDLGTTPAVAFGKTAPCQVLVDGAAVFTGKLYIEDVVSDQYNNVVYNCVVTNETVDFKTLVENRTLASLANNWSKYNHLYNWANVTSSWENKLFSGSVFYPLVNYGSQVNDPTSPIIGFTAPGVAAATGSMDNIATPLKVSQMKPAIQVKTILDEVFASVNYKYTSSFVNTDYFKSIYMLSSPDEKEGVSFVNMVSQSAIATPTSTQQLTAQRNFIFDKINYGTEITDTGNNWNPSTSTYTATQSGSVTISSNLTFTISNIPPSGFLNNNRTFQWQVQVNGAVVLNSNSSFGTATSGVVGLPATVLNLKAGDTVQIFGRYVGRIFNERFNITAGPNNSWIKVVGAPTSYNGTVNVGSVFAPDMKILDFIKGLAEKFNLVIEPVRNEKNILRIESFNDWIDQGTVVDWTEIIDRNVKYKVTSPLLDQARNLYLSDTLDEDVLNQNYKSIYGKIYGEYKFTTPLDLAQGDKRLGETFGATPTRYINNSKEVEVPWLCKEEDSKALVPFKFKPRLLHKQPFPQIVPQNEARGVSGSLTGYYILDGTTTRLLYVYNTALPTYRDSIVDPVPKSSLHFDSSTFRQYKLMPFNKYIPGAYDNYWSFWINEIYDIDARLLTCNIILKPSEIQNIQLNDKIFIDGHYYRINKINGANLVNTDSVEVELLKTAPRKIPYNGRRRILTPRSNEPNAYVDAIIDSYNDDGSITYSDFETGIVISDQEVIAQVVGIDGKDYYTGITWDNEQYQVYNPNVISLGGSKYNESHTNVVAIGSGNTITDYTANSFILGDNNIINPATYIDDATGSYGNTVNITLIASDATINDSTNIVLIQPSGSRTISGSVNNVLINPINDITINDPTGSVYTGNLRNQGTADFKQGATMTGSVDITGSLCVNGDCWPFTGSAIDTGSFLITASYSQPNITFTKGNGSTFNLNIGTNNLAQTSSYISVFDTTDQTIESALSASVMTFNNIDFNRGITLVSSSQFTLSQDGVYNLAFSAQFNKTGGGGETAWIWLRKNGTDVDNTNTSIHVPGGTNERLVAAWNFFISGSAGDYYELAWTATNVSVYLDYVPSVPGVYPAIPSLIATMNSIY